MGINALLIVEAGSPRPLAHTDVLGASVVERTVAALLEAGVKEIQVISAPGEPGDWQAKELNVRHKKVASERLWVEARATLDAWRSEDALLLMRMNSYCEADWPELFEQHRRRGGRVTRVWAGANEPLDIFLADPRYEKGTDFLVDSHLRQVRIAAERYQLSEEEYSHPLLSRGDLREIAADALNLRCRMRPAGREVRPGIWLAERCRIAAGVRLVAPVYVGRNARIRRGAVITRSSCVEHHSVVDCGTVVEDSSVLAHTSVGAGLDICHSVIGRRRVTDLRRKVEVEIQDPMLVAEISRHAGVRVLSKVAALASYLPLQFVRGLAQQTAESEPVGRGHTTEADSPVIKGNVPTPRRLRPELVMERYGNQ